VTTDPAAAGRVASCKPHAAEKVFEPRIPPQRFLIRRRPCRDRRRPRALPAWTPESRRTLTLSGRASCGFAVRTAGATKRRFGGRTLPPTTARLKEHGRVVKFQARSRRRRLGSRPAASSSYSGQ